MGGAVSTYRNKYTHKSGEQTPSEANLPNDLTVGRWMLKRSKGAALKAYLEDGSLLNSNLLEFRVQLDDHNFTTKFCIYAKSLGKLKLLMYWAEILEYKSFPDVEIELKADFIIRFVAKLKSDRFVDVYLSDNSLTTNTLPIADASHSGPSSVTKVVTDGSETHTAGRDDDLQDWVNSIYELSNQCKEYFEMKLSYEQMVGNVTSHVLDPLQRRLLQQMHTQIHATFIHTPEYSQFALSVIKSNAVTIDDFTFFQIIGRGNFGIVCHCMKKSTGKHYAMKVQSKRSLLQTYWDVPRRVTYEKEAAAVCQHPFIVCLDYSFHTPQLGFMVMELAESGSLFDSLKKCKDYRMPEERVVFYTAQIVLALQYIHRMGLIYRDLKPENVLLCADGCIKLTDMGGVCDVGGKCLGQGRSSKKHVSGPGAVTDVHAALFANSYCTEGHSVSSSWFLRPKENSNGKLYGASNISSGKGSGGSNQESSNNISRHGSDSLKHENSSGNLANGLIRAKSIMGTGGYMAPEMLILEAGDANSTIGYTAAVDYWSLGITVYRLLTGKLPFFDSQVAKFLSHTVASEDNGFVCAAIPYVAFMKKLRSTNFLSKDSVTFVENLLHVDETKRLGSASGGGKVKNHPFFKGINWRKLRDKCVVPPFMPALEVYNNQDAVSKDLLLGGHFAVRGFSSSSSDMDPAAAAPTTPPGFTFLEMMKQSDPTIANYESYLMDNCNSEYSLTDKEQAYFDTWDYVSPAMQRLEVSKAMELEELLTPLGRKMRSFSVSMNANREVSSFPLSGGEGEFNEMSPTSTATGLKSGQYLLRSSTGNSGSPNTSTVGLKAGQFLAGQSAGRIVGATSSDTNDKNDNSRSFSANKLKDLLMYLEEGGDSSK